MRIARKALSALSILMLIMTISPLALAESLEKVSFEHNDSFTKNVSTTDYVSIYYINAQGVQDPGAPVTVVSSDTSRIQVQKVDTQANGDNYVLIVPANAPSGTVTVTASSHNLTNVRTYTIIGGNPSPEPTPTPTPTPSPTPSPINLDNISFSAFNASLAGQKPTPDCTPQAPGKRYDIGSAQTPTLDDVPWSTLGAGDVVCIPYRATPYTNKINLTTSGAPGNPIRIVGLRGPNGERPVISGKNATTSKNAAFPTYALMEDTGVITIIRGSNSLWPAHPGYITIQGLKIQDGRKGNTYTAQNGTVRSYIDGAAGISINPANDIILLDNEITNNDNGIFAKSQGAADSVTSNLNIMGNYIHDNGLANSTYVHNVYVEALGCNIIGNYFGDLVPNAQGGNYGSRCAQDYVQANYLTGGTALLLLVNPQDGAPVLTKAQTFEPTVVAGNVIVDTGTSVRPVKFGGSDQTLDTYLKKLVFTNNTFVFNSNQNTIWSAALFFISQQSGSYNKNVPNTQNIWMDNNIVLNSKKDPSQALTNLYATGPEGTINIGLNWASPGFMPWLKDYSQPATQTTMDTGKGGVYGWSNLVSNTQNDPGFVNGPMGDVHLASNSPLLSYASQPIPTGLLTAPIDLYEFTGTPSNPWFRARPGDGHTELGAYEYVSGSPNGTASIPTNGASVSQATQTPSSAVLNGTSTPTPSPAPTPSPSPTPTPSPVPVSSFSDVTSSTPYASSIELLKTKNIITGYPDGTFKPSKTLQRAELLKLAISAKYPTIDDSYNQNCFSDVPRDQWYTKYVCFAKAKGFVSGYGDNTFRPAQEVNYAEALKITLETFGLKPTGKTDVWYEAYLDEAIFKNIHVSGTLPAESLSRAKAAELLARAMK